MRFFKYLKLKKKILITILSLLFSLAAIFIGTYYVARMRQEIIRSKAVDVSLDFGPQNLAVSVNSDFTLKVKINPGSEKVTAVELNLSFDKDRIMIENIESTQAFPTVLKSSLI